jgi:hypothetical protein
LASSQTRVKKWRELGSLKRHASMAIVARDADPACPYERAGVPAVAPSPRTASALMGAGERRRRIHAFEINPADPQSLGSGRRVLDRPRAGASESSRRVMQGARRMTTKRHLSKRHFLRARARGGRICVHATQQLPTSIVRTRVRLFDTSRRSPHDAVAGGSEDRQDHRPCSRVELHSGGSAHSTKNCCYSPDTSLNSFKMPLFVCKPMW